MDIINEISEKVVKSVIPSLPAGWQVWRNDTTDKTCLPQAGVN